VISVRLLLVSCLALTACTTEYGRLFPNPPVETRVRECLSGTIPWPDPPRVDTNRFRFAILTDLHFGDPESVALGWFRYQLEQLDIDFVCVLGDITDHGLPAEYEQARRGLDSFGRPCYCAIGNHDLYQSNGWQSFKQTFGPACFSLLIANRLNLIFLDTAEGTLGPTQFEWLETTLETDTSTYRIVLTHFPLYDGFCPTPFRLASPTERYKLQSILARHRVAAFVSGHIHGWRHTTIEGVNHFVAGSMAPGRLDYGTRGFLLFEADRDSLHWARVAYP